MLRRFTLFVLFAMTLSVYCQGQPAPKSEYEGIGYFMPQEKFDYNQQIPTPKDFLGYQVGQQHVTWEQAVAYMKELARLSPRVTVEEFGRTYERKPFIQVTITNEENQKNIEKIKTEHLALSDVERSATLNTETMPVVVSLGYSVHGNEASGINASLAVAYFFSAAEGSEVDNILKNAVILINPGLNPDGINRFATWVNAMRSFNDVRDNNSYEFTTTWPSGRSNHYWFDLNRDWMPAQHPEGQNALEMYFSWRPNVLNDHHEQAGDKGFFFQPGLPNKVYAGIPKGNYEITSRISEYHAKELDKIGSLYYSKEGYDDFYLGKGAAYPDMHGSIAMLFEQANTKGHRRETAAGTDVSMMAGARNQAYASYSSVRAAVEMRKELLDFQRNAYKEAVSDAKKEAFQGYLFTADDKGALFHFLELMARHKIEVYALAKNTTAQGQKFDTKTAYIVPLAQNESRMIRTLFDVTPQYKDSTFYDISAWTMPMAFNLKCTTLPSIQGLLGEKVTKPLFEAGRVVGGQSQYAYLFEPTQYYSYRMINELQKAGLKLQVGTKPVQIAPKGTKIELGYGTILVPVQEQALSAEAIYKLVSQQAAENGVEVYAVTTGLNSNFDLGSPSFKNLTQPHVAMVIGTGMSSSASGEVWHMLDQRFGMPPTMLDPASLAKAKLEKYNVLVMADGVPSGMSKATAEKIKTWVKGGGTLIATGGAYKWAVDNDLATVKMREDIKTPKDSTAGYKTYADVALQSAGRSIPGTIMKCKLDRTHPIGWGYKQDDIYSFRSGRTFFAKPANSFLAPVHYDKKPVASGYASVHNTKMIAETPAVLAGESGSGTVIIFADDPNFRAFWYGTNKMFMNALFFGRLISGVSIK